MEWALASQEFCVQRAQPGPSGPYSAPPGSWRQQGTLIAPPGLGHLLSYREEGQSRGPPPGWGCSSRRRGELAPLQQGPSHVALGMAPAAAHSVVHSEVWVQSLVAWLQILALLLLTRAESSGKSVSSLCLDVLACKTRTIVPGSWSCCGAGLPCSALPGAEGDRSHSQFLLLEGVCFPGGEKLLLSPDGLLWPSLAFLRGLHPSAGSAPSPALLRSVVHRNPVPKRGFCPSSAGGRGWLTG